MGFMVDTHSSHVEEGLSMEAQRAGSDTHLSLSLSL